MFIYTSHFLLYFLKKLKKPIDLMKSICYNIFTIKKVEKITRKNKNKKQRG